MLDVELRSVLLKEVTDQRQQSKHRRADSTYITCIDESKMKDRRKILRFVENYWLIFHYVMQTALVVFGKKAKPRGEGGGGQNRIYPDACGTIVDKYSANGIVVITTHGFPVSK